jgi:hypothetical protein
VSEPAFCPVFYLAFCRYLDVSDPPSAQSRLFLNWTVSVMMQALTEPTSFGSESSAATNWNA